MTTPTHVSFQGKPIALSGTPLKVGERLPHVALLRPDLSVVHTADLKGGWTILSTAPSLDTPVCSTQAKECEAWAGKKGLALKWIFVSEDLPFAQKRWIQENQCQEVQCLSDARTHDFARQTGLWIDAWGVLARAALAVDPQGIVRALIVSDDLTVVPPYKTLLQEAGLKT